MTTVLDRVVKTSNVGAHAMSSSRLGYKMPDLGMPWPFEITYLPNGWGVSIAEIYPDLAERMLAVNSPRQRKMRVSQICRFGDDIDHGLWLLTHQGCAFNRDGELFDGQNRLKACVVIGKPFWTLVFFGAGGQEEAERLDNGFIRRPVDAAKVAGLDGVNNNSVAAMRAFLHGPHGYRQVYSNPRINEQIVRYRPMIDFCHYKYSSKNSDLLRAAVRGAIGRALYHVEPERLIRFIDILVDRDSSTTPTAPGERSAVALRVSLVTNARRSIEIHDARDVYCRAQRAILGFVQGENLTKLFADDSDLFPLPTDEQLEATHALLLTD